MTLPAVDPGSGAQRAFERAAQAAGFVPHDRWVGGYAAYEWDHVRLALAAYGVDPAGRDTLEYGCNVGGSSVVLAALGARLSGVDVDPAMVAIARANLARHGLAGALHVVAEGGPLPFADAAFDLILVNSVLEYIDPRFLDDAIAELHRVLRPSGLLFICGTASRLALRERHSGRWLVNYVPRAFDRLTGTPRQRGLSPFRLARLLQGRFTDISANAWPRARTAIHGAPGWPRRVYALLGRSTGLSPGWFAPFIELLLRKTPEKSA